MYILDYLQNRNKLYFTSSRLMWGAHQSKCRYILFLVLFPVECSFHRILLGPIMEGIKDKQRGREIGQPRTLESPKSSELSGTFFLDVLPVFSQPYRKDLGWWVFWNVFVGTFAITELSWECAKSRNLSRAPWDPGKSIWWVNKVVLSIARNLWRHNDFLHWVIHRKKKCFQTCHL